MRWLSSFICAKVCFLPRGWPIFFVLCQENYKKNADRWRLHIMLNHHFDLQEHKIKHSLGHSGKNITSQAADTPTETPEISESGSQLCVKSQTMTSGLASPQRNLGQGCHSRLCLPIWDFPRVVLAFHYIKLSMIEAKVCNAHHDESPSLPPFQSWPWGRIPVHLPGFQSSLLKDCQGALCEISQRKTNTVWFHLYVESKKIQQKQI